MKIDIDVAKKEIYVLRFGVVAIEFEANEYTLFNMWLHYFVLAAKPKGLIIYDQWPGTKKLLIETEEDGTCRIMTPASILMNQCIVIDKEQALRIATHMYDARNEPWMADEPFPSVLTPDHRTAPGSNFVLYERNPGIWVVGNKLRDEIASAEVLIEDIETGYCHRILCDSASFPAKIDEALLPDYIQPYLNKHN